MNFVDSWFECFTTLTGLKPQMLDVKIILNPNVVMHHLSAHGSSRQEEFLDTLDLEAAV